MNLFESNIDDPSSLTSSWVNSGFDNQHFRYWELGEYGAHYKTLIGFMSHVLKTEQLPFEIHQSGNKRYATPSALLSGWHKSLDYYFYAIHDMASVLPPDQAYSPTFQLFFSVYQQHPQMQRCLLQHPNALLSCSNMLEAEVFNDFVYQLRIQAHQQNTRIRMQQWINDTQRYHAQAIESYVYDLVMRCEYLFPVRVDFQYHQHVFNLSDALPYSRWVVNSFEEMAYENVITSKAPERPEARARIDTSLTSQDRERFFTNLYRDEDWQVFQHLRGYILKMERGEDGANHFHCVFFFDANNRRYYSINRIIEVIGARWERVTEGRGFIFNCHNDRYQTMLRTHGRWALEPINIENEQQIERLTQYLVDYFAKEKGQAVHIKPSSKARMLTTGRIN